MARPANLPRWAETAGGAAAANIVEPNSGQKDTGWAFDQVPPSGTMNWWQWLVFKWLAWVGKGDPVDDDDLATKHYVDTATPNAGAVGDLTADPARNLGPFLVRAARIGGAAGLVALGGSISSGLDGTAVNGNRIATLPVGFRPAADTYCYGCVTNILGGIAHLLLKANGDVIWQSGPGNTVIDHSVIPGGSFWTVNAAYRLG